ncbi:MAG: EamA family transporter [Bacteroidota bacterium]
MKAVNKAHAALFTVALIYGANYTIAKEVLDQEYIQPLGFILLRAGAGFLIFTLLHLLFVGERVARKDLGWLLLCALFGVAINQMFFFSGLKLTTQINAALILTTVPLIVLLTSAVLLKERITPYKLLGIAAGAAGAILLITYGKTANFSREGLLGDLMVLINAISYGIYLVLVKRLLVKYHPFTVVRWVFTFGFFLVMPFGLRQATAIEWSTFTPGIWVAVAYVLICTSVLAYLLNVYAMKVVSPSIASIYIYLQPFLAAIIALYFGKDELTTTKLIAGVLIFTGVYLVSSQSAAKS